MRALLDVNVLIALFDPDHVFHGRAHNWWAARGKEGWASCPLTENGMIRVMSNPNYSARVRFAPGDLIARLSTFVAGTNHEFWSDSISLRDAQWFARDRIHGSRQLTDIYLLALATSQNGRLATFDESVPMSTVSKAKEKNLVVI